MNVSPSVNNTRANVFIPEIWSDEVIAAYKQNLVMSPLVTKMSFKGKKGDTLHIPRPTRGVANRKLTEQQVTLQAATENEVLVNIDQHFEYSRLIEDITEVQALASMRRFYTADAGYALARQVDTDLIRLGRRVDGGNGTAAYNRAVIGTDGSTLFTGTNGAALTDAAIRRVIQKMDDADVPMDGRKLVIPPVAKHTLLGLPRYTEQAFVGETGGGNTIRNGRVGNVYGVEVFVTTNADTATGAQGARIALMFHKDAFVHAEQMGVRSQTQYLQEYLATLYTADTLYGVAELRDEAAVAIAVAP